MYTLGLNGWLKGVHDPSAALFLDGHLIATAEEERFLRAKHAFDQLPFRSISACLKSAGITASELDAVAVGWDVFHTWAYSTGIPARPSPSQILEVYLPESLFPGIDKKHTVVRCVSHHEAHAASAFIASPFEKALVVVVDGSGEYESISLFLYDRKGTRKNILSLPFSESLGIFYQALTQFIGFSSFQEGKVMGLAAYGNPKYIIDRDLNLAALSSERLPLSRDQESRHIAYWLEVLGKCSDLKMFHPQMRFVDSVGTDVPYLEIDQAQMDLAASGQAWLERQLQRVIEFGLSKTGPVPVVMSGGVALNCPANQKIRHISGVPDVYVPSAPSDSGVGVGAAAAFLFEQNCIATIDDWHGVSGPSFSTEVIRKELIRLGARFTQSDDVEEDAARDLAKGKVLGWFQDGMEFGPRALGNRSILADPRNSETAGRVNAIKERELWRPLAPCIKYEKKSLYLNEGGDSPFMSFAFSTTHQAHSDIPAVIHKDGTTRPQTVKRDTFPRLWKLLDRFESLTGVPALLNTSFNIGSEPIVASPVDAVRSFFGSGLDKLFIGDYVLNKKNQQR